ncbi:hypothetical protein DRW48_12885 [Paracoccus suum]|uniref:Sulfotransferase family protein n=1 Tax=Paracoccus suum TaxID=2259340 RepID=A0A344PM49_9RHOB|nr:hypothetical protein [Paracoccus suum]AXC50454.1 hypothetical protein DRW48_12885 [Paracoccus suum]
MPGGRALADTAGAAPVRWPVNLLHIGKTGGTQLAQLGLEVNERLGALAFLEHRHPVRLRDLPRRGSYAFSIRQPEARFRSGFYSRKRCGQPRFYTPWHPGEVRAFAAFPEANDLAEALFDPGIRGVEARGAINSINHTAVQQVDWFTPSGYFLQQRPPVGIVRTEHFDDDWARLAANLGFAEIAPRPFDDPVLAHRNDYAGTPPLSARAVENLRQWYARDVAFYADCCAWMEAAPPPLVWKGPPAV